MSLERILRLAGGIAILAVIIFIAYRFWKNHKHYFIHDNLAYPFVLLMVFLASKLICAFLCASINMIFEISFDEQSLVRLYLAVVLGLSSLVMIRMKSNEQEKLHQFEDYFNDLRIKKKIQLENEDYVIVDRFFHPERYGD